MGESLQKTGIIQNHPAFVSGASLFVMAIVAAVAYFNQIIELFFGIIILDFIVSVSIYFFFREKSPQLALWSGASRAIYTILLLVIVILNFNDWQNFDESFSLILGVFGLHLLIQAWIFWELKTLNYVMACLIFVSGIGYMFDSMLIIFEWTEISPIAEFTFLGEIVMIFWFLVVAFSSD